MPSPPDPWRWIHAQVGDILKPFGLVKRGKAFISDTKSEVVTQIVTQRSRFNSPMWKRFALFLLIDVADRDATRFTRGQEAHYTPVFNKNIGYLWGDEAFMYTVPDVVPSSELAAQLRKHLVDHVMPLIRRCSSVEGLMSVVDAENRRLGANFFSMSLAIALARRGRMEDSRRYFQESLGDPELVRQAARGFGITL